MPPSASVVAQVLNLPNFDQSGLRFTRMGLKRKAHVAHQRGCPHVTGAVTFGAGREVVLCDCLSTRKSPKDLSPWQHVLAAAVDVDEVGSRTDRALRIVERLAAAGDRDGVVAHGSWDISLAHDDLWPSTSYGTHHKLTYLRERLLSDDVASLPVDQREALVAAEALASAALDAMRTSYLNACAGIDLAHLWSGATDTPATAEQFLALTHTSIHRRANNAECDLGMPMEDRALRVLTWATAPRLGIRPWRFQDFTSMLIVLPGVALKPMAPHLISWVPLTEPIDAVAADLVLRNFGERTVGIPLERFADIITAAKVATKG